MNVQRRITVPDSSAIGSARRTATQIASENGADETQTGRVAIVATELATNLALHAGGGDLLVQVLQLDGAALFEFLAIDSGPGMSDPQRCLSDGYSTAGTAGNGLGAIRRLTQFFDLYSQPERGTVIVARLAIGSGVAAPAAADALHHGAICIAVAGETVCGDGWQIAQRGDTLAMMVADGLGHGLAAHEASNEALAAFADQPWTPPTATLGRAHERMSATRGGSVACAVADRALGTLSYAGVGNICGSLVGGGTRGQGLVSHNGTVGVQMRRVQAFEYPFTSEQLLVMHSDGLSARWNLSDYPGLMSRHPALIAAVLFRDHGRARDDATVVVAKFGSV